MLQAFGILAGFLAAAAFIPYIRDILRLKTKPQRTTFLIWSILGGIAFFSQFAKGASNSLLLPGAETLLVVVVFLLSLKYGVGGFSRKDYVALGAVLVGLVAWYLTKEAAVALYIVIAIDAVGTILTIHKTYLDPGSETRISWVSSTFAGLFAALAVGDFNIILLSYPIYVFLANLAVVGTIQLGFRRKQKLAG